MRARIPAGIDLEDRLLYGLSPARLGYVAGLVVLAIWVWRRSMPLPLRILPAAGLLGAAVAVGWMKYEGRHLDYWAEDIVRHLAGRYRLQLEGWKIARPRAPFRTRLLSDLNSGVEGEPAEPAPRTEEVAVLVLASVEPP